MLVSKIWKSLLQLFKVFKSFWMQNPAAVLWKEKRQSHFLSHPNMTQEDKSSSGEGFEQLYTGFLYLCWLLWFGAQQVATLTPSSSQFHPHTMCHGAVNHTKCHPLPKQLFLLVSSHSSLQREFLLQKALAEPSGSFSSVLSKNQQVNQSQMLVFPSWS